MGFTFFVSSHPIGYEFCHSQSRPRLRQKGHASSFSCPKNGYVVRHLLPEIQNDKMGGSILARKLFWSRG